MEATAHLVGYTSVKGLYNVVSEATGLTVAALRALPVDAFTELMAGPEIKVPVAYEWNVDAAHGRAPRCTAA